MCLDCITKTDLFYFRKFSCDNNIYTQKLRHLNGVYIHVTPMCCDVLVYCRKFMGGARWYYVVNIL